MAHRASSATVLHRNSNLLPHLCVHHRDVCRVSRLEGTHGTSEALHQLKERNPASLGTQLRSFCLYWTMRQKYLEPNKNCSPEITAQPVADHARPSKTASFSEVIAWSKSSLKLQSVAAHSVQEELENHVPACSCWHASSTHRVIHLRIDGAQASGLLVGLCPSCHLQANTRQSRLH